MSGVQSRWCLRARRIFSPRLAARLGWRDVTLCTKVPGRSQVTESDALTIPRAVGMAEDKQPPKLAEEFEAHQPVESTGVVRGLGRVF